MLMCYCAMKREGALGCGTCTQKLSARRKKHNLLLNPREGKLRSKEEMHVVWKVTESKWMSHKTKTKHLCNGGVRYRTTKE